MHCLWKNEPILDGPWLDEPHHLYYTDRETGYECRLRRNPVYAWCGYVEVAEDHPIFKKDYVTLNEYLGVHGGITWSDYPPMEKFSWGDEKIWFVGFDCSHAYDLSPASRSRLVIADQSYRDLEYVKNEVKNLCRQLKELEGQEIKVIENWDDEEEDDV